MRFDKGPLSHQSSSSSRVRLSSHERELALEQLLKGRGEVEPPQYRLGVGPAYAAGETSMNEGRGRSVLSSASTSEDARDPMAAARAGAALKQQRSSGGDDLSDPFETYKLQLTTSALGLIGPLLCKRCVR